MLQLLLAGFVGVSVVSFIGGFTVARDHYKVQELRAEIVSLKRDAEAWKAANDLILSADKKDSEIGSRNEKIVEVIREVPFKGKCDPVVLDRDGMRKLRSIQ